MRYHFTLLAATLALASYSQAPYERIEVIELEAPTPAPELMQNAKRSLVDNFKDAQEVIQMEDLTTNTIVGKGLFKYVPTIR